AFEIALLVFFVSIGTFVHYFRLYHNNKINAQERATALCFLALEAFTELTKKPINDNKGPAVQAVRNLVNEFNSWVSFGSPEFAVRDITKLCKAFSQRVIPSIDRLQLDELNFVCNRLAGLLSTLKGKPALKDLGDIAVALEELPASKGRDYAKYLKLLAKLPKLPNYVIFGLGGSIALPIILHFTIGIGTDTAVLVWVGLF